MRYPQNHLPELNVTEDNLQLLNKWKKTKYRTVYTPFHSQLCEM
jgi:hypothetical protein